MVSPHVSSGRLLNSCCTTRNTNAMKLPPPKGRSEVAISYSTQPSDLQKFGDTQNQELFHYLSTSACPTHGTGKFYTKVPPINGHSSKFACPHSTAKRASSAYSWLRYTSRAITTFRNVPPEELRELASVLLSATNKFNIFLSRHTHGFYLDVDGLLDVMERA